MILCRRFLTAELEAWALILGHKKPGRSATQLREADADGIELRRAAGELKGKAGRRARLLVKRADDAVDALTRSNVRLVVSVVNRHVRADAIQEDTFQEGLVGLIKGIRRFNPELGHRFSTYVKWWIHHHVTRYVQNNGRDVRFPVGAQKAAARGKRVLPTIISLNEPVRNDAEDLAERIDLLADTSGPDPLQVELRQAVDRLSPRVRSVMILRFGLDGEDEHTIEQTCEALGLSKQWVQQLERVGLARLKRLMGD